MTCFTRLLLPAYSTKAQLSERYWQVSFREEEEEEEEEEKEKKRALFSCVGT
jgi:hypothetical protein